MSPKCVFLIFSARDDSVKVSWKLDARKRQNQPTPPFFDQLSERSQPLCGTLIIDRSTNGKIVVTHQRVWLQTRTQSFYEVGVNFCLGLLGLRKWSKVLFLTMSHSCPRRRWWEEGGGGGVGCGVCVGVIAGTSRRLHCCLKTLERKSSTGFLSSVVGAPAYPWRRVSQIQQVCCNAGLTKFKYFVSYCTFICLIIDWKSNVHDCRPLSGKLGWWDIRTIGVESYLGRAQQEQPSRCQVSSFKCCKVLSCAMDFSRIFHIAEVVSHKKFNFTERVNDIALLKTSKLDHPTFWDISRVWTRAMAKFSLQ